MDRFPKLFSRCTFMVLLAACGLAVVAVGQFASISLAQDEGQGPGSSSAAVEEDGQAAQPNIREVLQRRITVDFEELPLNEVLEYFKQMLQVQVVVKSSTIAASGIGIDSPVSIHLENVRADTALDLILSSIGADQFAYYTRDNLIIITTKDDLANTLTTRIYDVKDILAAAGDMSAFGGMGGGMPLGADPTGAGASGGGMGPMAPGMTSMMGMGGAGMGSPMMGAMMVAPNHQLASILESVIEPTSWETSGGPGVIRSMSGILIVRQTEHVHAQLEELLDDIRRAYSITATDGTTSPDSAIETP